MSSASYRGSRKKTSTNEGIVFNDSIGGFQPSGLGLNPSILSILTFLRGT